MLLPIETHKSASDTIGSGDNTYIARYKRQQVVVMADTSYEAQQIAAKHFRARKPYEVSVMLAEKGGKQVTHMPLMASEQEAEKLEAEAEANEAQADADRQKADAARMKEGWAEGAQGRKDWQAWFDQQSQEFQDKWNEMNEQYGEVVKDQYKTAAGGLYGYTKGTQRDVEATIRKSTKYATKLAKGIYAKDERSVDFLKTHAKRGSKTAKLLLVAMSSVGPRVASEKSANVFELPIENKTAAKRKSPSNGMYGFPSKVARLSLTACSDLKSYIGEITYDLHSRRAAKHERITGFLKEHSKTAKCGYSRMILSCYPDAPKVAKQKLPKELEEHQFTSKDGDNPPPADADGDGKTNEPKPEGLKNKKSSMKKKIDRHMYVIHKAGDRYVVTLGDPRKPGVDIKFQSPHMSDVTEYLEDKGISNDHVFDTTRKFGIPDTYSEFYISMNRLASRGGHHYTAPDGTVLVDTAFLNSLGGIRGVSLQHMGFGEFFADTPKGRVDFIRGGADFPGKSGRSHKVRGPGAEWLVAEMTSKGKSEEMSSHKSAAEETLKKAFVPDSVDGWLEWAEGSRTAAPIDDLFEMRDVRYPPEVGFIVDLLVNLGFGKGYGSPDAILRWVEAGKSVPETIADITKHWRKQFKSTNPKVQAAFLKAMASIEDNAAPAKEYPPPRRRRA